MKTKLQNMEFNKLKNLTSFYKSAVIILIVLILIFSATTYVFYGGFTDYKCAIRTDEFGNRLCLVLTDQGDGITAGETPFDGYHLSYRFPNELFTHLAVVVIALFLFPLFDFIMKKSLNKNSDRDTMVEKYTFNRILAIVLLIIIIILFIFSVFYSISYIKYQSLVFEQPEGSGIYVRPWYTYEEDNGNWVYDGIRYTIERIEN
ncbi:MAG: hypothetical protein E7564_06165 [Ruminococcaceae bacterium]|nr:hypothetical protein [Oscillospiraceae bacterium]